jgi:hypothetical protein
MQVKVITALIGSLCVASWVNAQAPSSPPPSQSRPDAQYANPSGQDSKPSKTTVPKAAPPAGSVEQRGTQTSQQSKPVQPSAKQKSYQGNVGKKGDVGTACSTARPTPQGGVDCGTGGEGATPGKVPK